MFSKVILILLFVSSTRMQSFRRLAAGPYYVKWKEIGACPTDKRGTNEVFVDIHFKRTNRKMAVFGNSTLLIPFGDDISIDLDFAVYAKNAAWIPNYFNFHFTNACSAAVNYLRKLANLSVKCPIPKGVYELKGFDLNEVLQRSTFPKEFIYGRYKATVKFVKNGRVVGCFNSVLEMIPIGQRKSKEQTTETQEN